MTDKTMLLFVLFVVASFGSAQQHILTTDNDRCTTIVVGAKAGIEGPMNTHTSDCFDCDFRVNKVPAEDWPAGSVRPLYLYRSDYPSIVSPNRGVTWQASNLVGSADQLSAWGTESTSTGFIPQVNHTFALIEGQYGIMNEHQVAIGESTCAARFWAAPTAAGGLARVEARLISQIALERCTTARETIQMMGDLAVKYGFYAADWGGGDGSLGEAGEALTVIDKTEAWVFHILGDDTGTSAIWVAQRVEDDHVSVVANQFTIREVDPDSDMFMYSDNLWEVAIRNQLWSEDSGKKLDFLKTYGLPRAHTPYATRRVWRVFGLVAPSVTLPPNTNMWGDDYPFSVKADSILTPQDLMRIQRDHYEGTQFDLTQGLQAGPYGEPNRWDVAPVDNLTAYDMIQGSYERAISLYRTSYSFVAQSRAAKPDSLALMWFAPYAPATSAYTPFYIATTSLPVPYTSGSLFQYDSSVSYWNFCAAGNYAARMYKYAITDIHALQDQLMTASIAAVQATESLVAAGNMNAAAVIALVTTTTLTQGALVVDAWRNLLPQLITKYHDGYIAYDLTQSSIQMRSVFYPKWWLDITGYWNNKPNLGPGILLFDSDPTTATTTTSSAAIVTTAIVSALLSCVCTLLIGAYWLRNRKFQQRHEYIAIDL